MPVAQVPVNECLKEVCEGGCTNALTISDEPTLVNANGSSLVGVTAVVKASCSCSRDDGSAALTCTPDSCLHGGICIYNRNSQTTRYVALSYILFVIIILFLLVLGCTVFSKN